MNHNNFDKLKLWFQEKGITQEEICGRVDLSQSYMSMLFAGKRDLTWKLALRFQDAYGINAYWLMKDEGEMFDKDFKPQLPSVDIKGEPSNKEGNIVDRILLQNEQLIKQNTMLVEQQSKLIHIIETYASNK